MKRFRRVLVLRLARESVILEGQMALVGLAFLEEDKPLISWLLVWRIFPPRLEAESHEIGGFCLKAWRFDMDYDFDDFEVEYEPTIADVILADASVKLREAIKKDAAGKIRLIVSDNERLKRNNERLLVQNNALRVQERDVAKREKELERKAKRMPLGEFMGQRSMVMWKAGYNFVNGDKCDKCDRHRKIHYKTPTGRDATERCDCYRSDKIWRPKQSVVYEMRRNKRDASLLMWFKIYNDDENGFGSGEIIKDENIYTDQPFPELNYHTVLFADEGKCQEYCDWKMEKK